MARIKWGSEQANYGVDRGVAYINGEGYPLNGLVSVATSYDESRVDDVFFDGRKVNRAITRTDFRANIELLTIPDAIRPCLGYAQRRPGYFIGSQVRQPFTISYRVMTPESYKIGIVYNLTADSLGLSAKTDAKNVSVTTHKLSCAGKPVLGPSGLVHQTFLDAESYGLSRLLFLERILYGFDGPARPLMPEEVVV